MQRSRRQWYAVNRQFCENPEVIRWRAVGNRQRWRKRSVRRKFDSGCELRHLHAELSQTMTEDRETERKRDPNDYQGGC